MTQDVGDSQSPTHRREVGANMRSRIAFQVEAGKQFLVVVIGLGLTSSIAEKLKYRLGENIIGINWSGDTLVNGETKYSISSYDNSLSPPFDSEFSSIDTVCLGVFLIYAIRFFFNNYIYLCEAYDTEKLRGLDSDKLKYISRCAFLDLLLSLFTGVVICIVSMALDVSRTLYLLSLIILHYLIDTIIMGLNAYRRRAELHAKRLFLRVALWLVNNLVFMFYFLFLLLLMFVYPHKLPPRDWLSGYFSWTIWPWLANCCIAYIITILLPDKVGDLPNVSQRAS